MTTDPHENEYLAAVAALPDQTLSRRSFSPGQTVLCPRAFGCGRQVGTVHSTETDRHLGHVYLVDTQEGRLRMLPDELELI